MLFLVNAISMSDHSITCVTDPIQKPGKTDEKRLWYAQSPVPIRDAHHVLIPSCSRQRRRTRCRQVENMVAVYADFNCVLRILDVISG